MNLKFVSYFLTTITLLFCCNCASCKKQRSNTNKMDIIHPLLVDDSVMNIYGDSIAKIIFEADNALLLKLTVAHNTADSIKNDTIAKDSVKKQNQRQNDFHGCSITDTVAVLSKIDLQPLKFILADRSTYFDDSIRVKSPFMPAVALRLNKGKKEQIDIIFSFSGGQMHIYTSDDSKIYKKYYYERLILKYFQQYLKDENIQAYLNLNIN